MAKISMVPALVKHGYFSNVIDTGTGANAGEFNVSSTTCGSSLAAGVSCTMSVQFAPTVAGSKTASLVISGDGTAGLPLSVGITGAAY